MVGVTSPLCRLTTTHDTSRRSLHSRPTDPHCGLVSPGQRVLTTSFATRKSRVQIPPAPRIALVRAIVGVCASVCSVDSVVPPLHGRPTDSSREAPRNLRGAFSLRLTSVVRDVRARVADAGNRRFGSRTDGPPGVRVASAYWLLSVNPWGSGVGR